MDFTSLVSQFVVWYKVISNLYKIITHFLNILIYPYNFEMKFSISEHCEFSLLSSSFSPLILILSNSTLFPSWQTYYFMWWKNIYMIVPPWKVSTPSFSDFVFFTRVRFETEYELNAKNSKFMPLVFLNKIWGSFRSGCFR